MSRTACLVPLCFGLAFGHTAKVSGDQVPARTGGATSPARTAPGKTTPKKKQGARKKSTTWKRPGYRPVWKVGNYSVRVPYHWAFRPQTRTFPAIACNLIRTRCLLVVAYPPVQHRTARAELTALRTGRHRLSGALTKLKLTKRGRRRCGRWRGKACNFDNFWAEGSAHIPGLARGRFSLVLLTVVQRHSRNGVTIIVLTRGPGVRARGIFNSVRYNNRALRLF